MTSGLVRVDYEDEDGRWWAVLVEPGQEATPEVGLIVGPPDVSVIESLPEQTAIRLHNELFRRGVLTKADLRGGRKNSDIEAAIKAAMKLDFAAVTNLYQ